MKPINNQDKECSFAELKIRIIDERYKDKLISSLVAQGLMVYQEKDESRISVVALIEVDDLYDSIYNN